MRFDCGLNFQEKREAQGKWHNFFAIWPRRVAHRDCRWLETIERRIDFLDGPGWSFVRPEYRARS